MDIRSLADDVLFLIMDYLDMEDSWFLAISDERFFNLFRARIQYKRSFNFEKCYQFSSDLFEKLTNQLDVGEIRQFNVAGCSWLPAKTLLELIYRMNNLEELIVNDTELDLNDIINILSRCPKVTKLSFSFDLMLCIKPYFKDLVKALWSIDDGPKFLGFGQIKSLRILCHGYSREVYWMTVLRLLKWCTSCDDLHMEWDVPLYNDAPAFSSDETQRYSYIVCSTVALSPWMKNLRSFVFLTRGKNLIESEALEDFDEVTHTFLACLFKLWKPQLERFRVGQEIGSVDFGASILSPKKSWNFIEDNLFDIDCKSLVESAGLEMSRLIHSPNLRSCNVKCKFIRFYDFDEEFIRNHSDLKELHVTVSRQFQQFLRKQNNPFQFSKLETLGLTLDCEGRLIARCPNLRELIIENGNCCSSLDEDTAEEIVELKNLRVLKTGVRDPSPLYMILDKNQRLECLHIWSHVANDGWDEALFDGFRQMQLPGNIREFALQWDTNFYGGGEKWYEMSFPGMLTEAKRWKGLRVLILHKNNKSVGRLNFFKDRLFELLAELKDLRYLCLIGNFEDGFMQHVQQEVKKRVQSVRPYFRFYIGPELYHTYYPYE